MRQMLSAVKHLHIHGIVHRDLKPENFLLATNESESEIKLIDFGLSKRFVSKQDHMHTVVGTPFYVAPEVLKGDYDYQCDVWSLGVILFILLCGYPPFEGNSNKDIFHRVLNQDLIFDAKDWNDLSSGCKSLVRNMLTKDPKSRPTAEECL
jgi:calcium-dependent protein kinase